MASKIVIVALLLSAFFPHFEGGARLEHLVFPGAVVIFGLICIARQRAISPPVVLMSLMLFSGAVFAVVGSSFSPDAGAVASEWAMGTRLVLPAIVFGATAVCLPANCNVMAVVAKTIVLMAVPISFLALSSAFFDVSWLLNYYVKSDEDAVWSQAFSLGRFTGLFNQPLEAGVFHSVALLALVYLASLRWWRPMGRYFILAVIVVGGSLSLSKNFVVLGVLTALAYAVSVRVLSLRSGIFWFGVMVVAISIWLTFGNEDYANAFFDLFAEGGLLLALTAGRLGAEDTEVAQLWSHLLSSGQWLTGAGLGAYLPLDNGYLEYFYQGGVLPMASYLLFIFGILILAIRHRSIDESKLLFFLGLFVAASSLGGPVITANRANVPLLMLIASCILCIGAHRKTN